MIILIIIIATVLLLWILLYPTIMRLYHIFHLGKRQMEKENNNPDKPITSETEASIVGKSNFTLSQPVPTTTTPMAEESIIRDDAHTFATESDPAPMDIDYSLEKESGNDEDNLDEDDEAVELKEMFGKDVCFASGVVIDELHKLKHVIESPKVSQTERQEAGKILYENKETEIVEQLSSGKTASIISELIDLHVTLHQKEHGISKNVNESEELESFDVNQFLTPK